MDLNPKILNFDKFLLDAISANSHTDLGVKVMNDLIQRSIYEEVNCKIQTYLLYLTLYCKKTHCELFFKFYQYPFEFIYQ